MHTRNLRKVGKMEPRDKEIIVHLNTILKQELTAINQYFLHAKMYDDWGLKKLGEQTRAESVDEMKHAEALMERILFLGGLPNLQDLGKLYIGQEVREMLECDLRLETEALPNLRNAIAFSENCGDYVSRTLFEDILSSEESHVDWLETNIELIDRMGLANYLQSQAG